MTAPTDRAPTDRYRPCLRPEVLVSDALLLGPRTVHLVKNPRSGKSYEVGVKEHFLMARMDGTRALDELGEQYAAEYGKRLGDANWQQLLAMLGTRGCSRTAPPPRPPRSRRSPRAPCCAAPSRWSPTPTRRPNACTGPSGSCSPRPSWSRCSC